MFRALTAPFSDPARGFLKSSLELCDQARQRFRLFIRGDVTTGQTFNPATELA
jgi:hypothetical protein